MSARLHFGLKTEYFPIPNSGSAAQPTHCCSVITHAAYRKITITIENKFPQIKDRESAGCRPLQALYFSFPGSLITQICWNTVSETQLAKCSLNTGKSESCVKNSYLHLSLWSIRCSLVHIPLEICQEPQILHLRKKILSLLRMTRAIDTWLHLVVIKSYYKSLKMWSLTPKMLRVAFRQNENA